MAATLADHQLSALRSIYPAHPEQTLTALLMKWRQDNNKLSWDSYVNEMHAFSSFWGQPREHFIDAQFNTWLLHDFFN